LGHDEVAIDNQLTTFGETFASTFLASFTPEDGKMYLLENIGKSAYTTE
jgi:hypothetical protein